MNFFDYLAHSPKEELRNAFCRASSDGLEKFGSLKGRSICLLKVLTHTSCIVLKPLFYVLGGIIMTIHTNIAFKGELDASMFEKRPDSYKRFQTLENNPEFKNRSISSYKKLLLIAPIAILSQIIQVIKAVMGILHPGFYFRNDPLTPLMHRLAVVARRIGGQTSLIQELDKGSKAIEVSGVNISYVRAKYTQYLNVIVTKLEDPTIPDPRKLSVLSLLNVDEDIDISGIKGCIAGLGRTLQDMCAMINIPENPAEVVPFFLEKFKKDVLAQMVLSAENLKDFGEWKVIVNKLGWDQAHRGTALTAVIGTPIGLSQEAVAMAYQDPFVAQGIKLTGDESQALLDEFNKRFQARKIDFLLSMINSAIVQDPRGQVDVSPGLKVFRQKALEALCNSVTPAMLSDLNLGEGNEADCVEKTYQKNNGIGDRSETGFNDLNAKAIQFLLDNPNCFA
jgi:hypothetical protein